MDNKIISANRKERLIELDKLHLLHPTSSIKQHQEHGPANIFVEGNGIYLKDIDGNTFMDARSTLWNVNIGHGRKELADVAHKQMSKLAYTSLFGTDSHEPAIKLSEKIASLTPGDLNTVFFTSGGSESNDTAIKLARYYWRLKGQPERKKIISRQRAYHGVSATSTSATGLKSFWEMAGVLMPDFFHALTPYESNTQDAIKSLSNLIEKEGPETIAAFIAEPIQGAGGVIIPPDDYLIEVRKMCDKYGILFIADEVICGFGRTGKMFGMDHWNVVPDMMTFAKGVTSGYIPLGGVIITERFHQVLKDLSEGVMSHGFTYSGHPTACAVALENINIIESEGLIENARIMGEKFLKGFHQIQDEIDIVGNIRVKGLLAAIELYEDPATKKRFPAFLEVSQNISREMLQRGIICRPITHEGTSIIAFSPPLIINEKEVQIIIDALHDAILATRTNLNI